MDGNINWYLKSRMEVPEAGFLIAELEMERFKLVNS